MHVDGFRFNLPGMLGRQDDGFARAAAFLDLVAQDPVVSGAKLVGELSKVGPLDGYDLGLVLPVAVAPVEQRIPRHDARSLARPSRRPR